MNLRAAPRGATSDPPSHHHPAGGFRDPWGDEPRTAVHLLRWQGERRRNGIPPDPPAGALPLARSDVAIPRAPLDELRLTWIGHASFLVQIGGFNLLTDPVFSRRASPVQWAGPARFQPPGVAIEALPPIDAVLLSHDHYDHLDAGSVRALDRRFGDRLVWFTPLGYRGWFRRRGIRAVVERDWWEDAELEAINGTLRITATPARHWTARTPFSSRRRLWCGWAVRASAGPSFLFAGDTGYFPAHAIRETLGGFDALAVPIGAYEPRWFMRPAHMNPEDAVRFYRDLGAEGLFAGMHWGTFRLTDEDPLEPPTRTREAWSDAGLPADRLWLPAHGETRVA